MKCGVNARILEDNRDGIALCTDCGFRVSVVLTYDVKNGASFIRIPPNVPHGQTVRAPLVLCAACRGPGSVRSSRAVLNSLRVLRIYCQDKHCGQRANAYLELIEQLTALPGTAQIGIPYRAGLTEQFQRELSYTNKLPRLIHEK